MKEAATHLPWLSPCAASLVALTRAPTDAAWAEVRTDPGCVLLVLRHVPAVPSSFPLLLRDPSLLEEAVRNLDGPVNGFVDWNQPPVRPIYEASWAYAQLARRLAERTGRVDPETAWVSGLLAPLGWMAVAAVDLDQTGACLADPDLADGPARVQQQRWGLDQAGIARRLAQRWRLPLWLTAVVGHLGLPVEIAQSLGADPDLFRVVQLAVALAQQRGIGLGLAVGAPPDETASALGLSADEFVQSLELKSPSDWELWALPAQPPIREWTAPQNAPWLRDLLCLAAENRRLEEGPVWDRLQSDVDHLHRALEEQRAGESERLQTLKLRALAEFAAGAGHEINNPLAVISGQAQYLLSYLQVADSGLQITDCQPNRDHSDQLAIFNLKSEMAQRALQKIIGQTQRIYEILSELMQFARPPRPQKQTVNLANLIREVMLTLGDWAAQRRVRLIGPEPEPSVNLDADPHHLQTALTCLLRNAIEAAPADGWAAIRLEMPTPDRVELVVEDSGTGPALSQREHLFDPFYSGRQAGRGRGLGLPTAWRLARQHGGDVRFDRSPDGPTRFVLSLPLVRDQEFSRESQTSADSQNQESGIRSQESGIGNQQTEVNGQGFVEAVS